VDTQTSVVSGNGPLSSAGDRANGMAEGEAIRLESVSKRFQFVEAPAHRLGDANARAAVLHGYGDPARLVH